MIEAIRQDAVKQGITRLCHFTPSRSLAHILAGGAGILPSRMLEEEDRLLFNPTDLQRLDGHPDHICCSIEYPNAWYLDRARKGEILFRDWVVIFIDPAVLAFEGTLFCPRNAAAGNGAYISAGHEAFASMFALSVPGAQGKVRSRGLLHLPCSPTDDQAEVLVPNSIPPTSIIAIGLSSKEQAQTERVRLEILDIDVGELKFVVSPTLFDKYALSSAIRSGQRPSEKLWTA